MTKYRIRLVDGRIIGPFSKDQLLQLKAKGHLSGKEEAQIFPTGDWEEITTFEFYQELADHNKTSATANSTKEETFIIDLTKLRKKSLEKEIEELEEIQPIQTKELTKTIQLTPEEIDETSNTPSDSEAFELAISEEVDEDVGEKTTINPEAQKELEKMRQRLQKVEESKKVEEARKAEEERRKQEVEALAIKLREEEKDESTQVIKLDNLKLQLLEVANAEEVIIEKAGRDIAKKKAEKEAAENEDDDDDDDDDEEEASKKKRFQLILLVAAILIGYAILFPKKEPEKPPFRHVPPQMVFPLPFDKADKTASTIRMEKGQELFAQGGYLNIIKAGIHFKESYENDLQNISALSLLVRSYAEQLKYSKEMVADSQVLFNIIQSKRPMLMMDPNGIIGLNLFYMTIDKHDAAVDVTAKYLKLNPKNVTQDLFATYLNSLLKVGKLEIAKQIYTALENAPDKNRYTYEALIRYFNLNQESEKAEGYVDEAIKKNPALVSFYLMKAEILLKKKNFKETSSFLRKVEEMNLEYNDLYRAKFFEITGLLLAASGDVEKGTLFLVKSLEIEDSNDLRMRLADLSSTNGTLAQTDKLIGESKAIKLLNQAKDFYDKKNYELALSAAARASDAHPGHIPSDLFLAKVQMRLGLAEQSIKTMEELLQKYPSNKDINFAMIDAYIETYKFNDAKNRIAIVAGMDIKNNWEFASLNAKLYTRMGDSLQTLSWLKASINMNPLNDRDIFHLAETFLKRNNFDAAQLLLNKCMELDPVNADYRIAYAKLIYERQDDQAAVGYLLGLLDEFGENPKFLSEIAIFYFRAGKVKDFMAYKEKLSKLPKKDKALYEFLIKAALLDERYSEIPILVEQLLLVEPGDLESMMTAGSVLFENGKLEEAALWFKRVQDKLATYPKVQYYIAKIKMLAGEIDDPVDSEGKSLLDNKGKPILGAIGLIMKDIKENGENDVGLVLLAEIYTAKGEFVDAENHYKKAQKLNPNSYEALVGLADISSKRNNFDLSLDLYRRAMKQKTDEPILYRKVGDVYRLLGQGALAMESYKMYLEMNPDATDKDQVESYINIMK
jgi:tetratricopeptide (TPR) repeat protein